MPNMPGSVLRALGRYRLHDEIVSGGMGVVRFGSVREDGRNRVVAIKQLNPSLMFDPQVEAAFLREAGLAVRIRHENVVRTIEVGVHDGELFVVMQYLHGESLSRVMRASGDPAPPDIASRIAIDVLNGLAEVHDARDDEGRLLGVVHRDVSPHNVLVGAEGTSFVLDFGIAKVAGETTDTRPGLVKGKISYMSPEQLREGAVTPATDLFATAVMLWEMLTGIRLFASGSVGSLMRRIAEGRIEPPSVHAPDVPSALDALVIKRLDPEPARGFANASVFAEELARVAPPASRARVAAWMQVRVAPILEQRARIVRAIEQEGMPVSSRRQRGGLRPLGVPAVLAVAAVASALGILAGVLFFASKKANTERISSTPASEVVVGTTHGSRSRATGLPVGAEPCSSACPDASAEAAPDGTHP